MSSTSPSTSTVVEPAPTADELPQGPSALTDINDPTLPTPLVDPAEIISGGPPPDGIPAIDAPQFESVTDADSWLEATEPVVALDINGETRAYPVQILIWHEIVNDTVGGTPVAVTYCPLCNSAVTYERTIRGVETTFGTSGKLYASALVMYDRATESLWTHFDGRAVAGVLTGEQLRPISSPLLAWSDFQDAYPDGQVLSRATGYGRDYGQNPYFGYDDPEAQPFLFRGSVDDRSFAMQRVVGITLNDISVAFSLDAISGDNARATNTSVGESDVVILWLSGQNSALEDSSIAGGRDVGSVGVFSVEVGGRSLSFTADGDHFVDEETGSTWDITGRAVAGPLEGSTLEAIPHLDTFWFAWSTYRPGTTLVEE